MNLEFAVITQDQLAVALQHGERAAQAADAGDIAALDEATASLQAIARPDYAPHLSEAEWRSITRLFGQCVTEGELSFVIHGKALDRWITSARDAGVAHFTEWLEAAKSAGHAVLQLPLEGSNE